MDSGGGSGEKVYESTLQMVWSAVMGTKRSVAFPVRLDLLTTTCPVYRGSGQTSESYRFIPVVTSHDLL